MSVAKLSRAVLEERLRVAEDTLEAIRTGQVDALVVDGPEGPEVFTLKGVDHRYRQLVETMTEGALLVARDGVITYANARFAELVAHPLETMVGSRLAGYVAPAQHALLDALLRAAGGTAAKAELELVVGDARVPVYVSATLGGSDEMTCVIVTDLSEQKRTQALVAAEQLTAQIVEQAADGVVVCDAAAKVIRASEPAQRLASANPLLQPFADLFRIHTEADPRAAHTIVLAALAGRLTSGEEVCLTRPGGETRDLLLSAGPITGAGGEMLGCVISFVDITDRKRAARERLRLLERAEEARVEAEAANRAKDEFLAMLGHELRNPLAPILTALELMTMKGDTTSLRERGVIERHVKDVVRLVGDLLDVSRIAQGKVELDRKPVELATLVAQAIETASPLVAERQHHLEVSVPEDLWLDADGPRIGQVLSNLLTNAAKYTQRGGRITLRAARVGAELVVTVADNGMGIPRELLPRLFDLFVQGRRTIDRSEGGLGLGLSIVRNLVRVHGGSVAVRSPGVGQGSEFEVRLPALPASAAEAGATSASPTRAAPARAGHRVLVVDDNEDAAELLAYALETLGHQTRTAYDGPSALEVAAEFVPDIAVLDIGLPVMDGYELARRLRAAAAAPLRLIALTGYGSPSDRERTAEAGFDAHMVKPIDLASLESTLARYV